MKKKIEFSKVIMLVAGITNLLVILFTCFMVWYTKDTMALTYLIPSVAAEVTTGTGFYYAKARTENRIKLKKSLGLEIDKDDVD